MGLSLQPFGWVFLVQPSTPKNERMLFAVIVEETVTVVASARVGNAAELAMPIETIALPSL